MGKVHACHTVCGWKQTNLRVIGNFTRFCGDGLPELVMDIIGDGLHILKYLPDEEIVELFFGYERMPYYHLLGSGQLYYKNDMVANKGMWRYDIVDADGQDRQIVSFMEDADYKPHKEEGNHWWDMAYWVYLDEELDMVQVDEKQYRKITEKFFDALEHAVPAMTFEEIFGRSVSAAPPQPSAQTQPQEQAWNINSPAGRIRLCCG